MSKFAQLDRVWPNLPVVEAIQRGGNIAAAAEQLAVNRTTVDRRLQNLEAELGGTLFIRRRGRLEITPFGEQVLNSFERAAGELTFLDQLEPEQATGGQLRLSASPHFMSVLAPIVLELTSGRFQYDVTVATDYGFADLHHGEAEIAVRIIKSKPVEPLIGRKVSPVYGALFRAQSTDQPYAVIGRPGESNVQDYIPKEYRDLPFIQVTSWDCQKDCVAAGGIGRLPMFYGRSDHRLLQISDPLPPENWTIWVLTHLNFVRAPRIQRVMDFLTTEIKERLVELGD